uniref:Uncharacterized protein n=1 Tax=Populus trichocarpa TaxID=3694 RepID=U5G4C6_POPTR
MTQQNSQETPLVYMVWKRVLAIAHGFHLPQLKIVRSSRNPWHGFAHQRALHLQRKLRVLRQVYPKITRNPLEALKQPSKPRLNSGYPHSSAWTNPSPKIGTHDVSSILHEPL